jgi:hypothetical protein
MRMLDARSRNVKRQTTQKPVVPGPLRRDLRVAPKNAREGFCADLSSPQVFRADQKIYPIDEQIYTVRSMYLSLTS